MINRSINADETPPRMTADACFHQQLKATRNRSQHTFNRLDSNFKFVVMTLANRAAPGTFRQDDVGQPFEYFDSARRAQLITAMNEIARWGNSLPRRFSIYDCTVTR